MTVSEDEIQNSQEISDSEFEDAFKNLGIKTSETSPRGVLDIPISDGSSVSDSPTSSTSSSCGSSEKPSSPQTEDETEAEAEPENRGGGGDGGRGGGTLFNPLTYGVQLKGFIDIMKRKSGVRRLSTTTINLLNSYDISAKSLRKKLARIRSAEDNFDCGLLAAAKPSWRNFKYSELAIATDHFSPGRLLGKGGHAEVYKGCLPDGTVVAVKRLTKKGETEDEERTADFLSELGIIAHVDHPNTASLVGFSVEGGLYLVLQFAPNGSIESYLQGAFLYSSSFTLTYEARPEHSQIRSNQFDFIQKSKMESISSETAIQVAFLALTLAIFFVIYRLPNKAFSKLRSNTRANSQSSRHFLNGAQLLSRARSARHRATAESLAKEAVVEADRALSLLPRDAAALILRALALDVLGRRASALRSLDAALSPPAVKSLLGREKGDALVKRAELQLAVNRRRRVDSALSDLVEAVSLTRDNTKCFCLLGQCYEIKGMKDEACEAFREALKIEPESTQARQGLDRLKSSST